MDFPTFSIDTSLLEEAAERDPEFTYDLLIVGGGPAAMSAAVYAARKMLRCAMVTRDFGGQIRETSEVENWLGFQNINAKDLADSFEEHVKSFDIPVKLGTAITKITKEKDTFSVTTDDGTTYHSPKPWFFQRENATAPSTFPVRRSSLARAWPIVPPVTHPFLRKRRSWSPEEETLPLPRCSTS
jgi:hypothetical protein